MYSGVFRCILVYFGVFWCIPVYFGVFRCLVGPFPRAMDVSGSDLTEIRSMTRATVATAAPPEREQSFGGGGGGLAQFDLSGVGRGC